MGRKRENVLGQRFGRLVVLSDAPNGIRKSGQTYRRVLCKCDCGNEIICALGDLKKGSISSCKCYRREYFTKHNGYTKGSNMARLISIYDGMKRRCLNSNRPCYGYYGGRGISVCKEWMEDFNSFKDWSIKNGYSDNLTIDRIDVNGNYEPSNCRWTDFKTQANNRRNNHNITIFGVTKTLSEWCEYLSISKGTFKTRKKLGWSDEEALCKRIRGEKEGSHMSKVKNLMSEYARRKNL